MAEPTFHMLLIGADGYFPNLLPNRATYRSLAGCVHDVERVRATLQQRLGDRKLAITSLLAPAGAGGEPTGDDAAWPTAANIRRALAELAERVQPGDQVYLHYSGHGGQVATAWKDMKGANGVDEALVPIDIGRPDAPGKPTYARPERYVRDVELAYYLDHIARKADAARPITMTLVFDSCHSGGATRGFGGIAKRSATDGQPGPGDPYGAFDRSELTATACAYSEAQMAGMAEAFARQRSGAPRSMTPQTSWLPAARGYVLLAACRDVESALECSLDGKPCGGILTDALLEALDALGSDQSWRMVYQRVLARVHSQFGSQTPQLLGDIDRHVFGVDLKPMPHTLAVTAVDRQARIVTINGGLASTVDRGSELGIYQPGTTDFSLPANKLAIATVTEANALEARAALDDAADLTRIAPGAPAVIQGLPLRRKVELLSRTDLPPSVAARASEALAQVGAAIERDGRGFLEVCRRGVTPHYQIAVSSHGTFEVCDPQGKPFSYLEPVIAIDADRAASMVVAQLLRLVRYHLVLGMAEHGSVLHDQLHVELLVAPPDWTRVDPPSAIGGTPLVLTGDTYSVRSETWLWLRLTNKRANNPLNVALLYLSRKWEVEMVIPNPAELAGRKYETITQPRTFAFKMYAPIAETIDILKLFITVGDVDFHALTTASRRTRSITRGGENALGRLVDAINASEHRVRSPAAWRSAGSPWAVQEFRIRTYQ